MGPEKRPRPRPQPYDPELRVNWTLSRLREECDRRGIVVPSTTRRMALVRLLDAANNRSNSALLIHSTAYQQSNGGDRAVIDLVSQLTSTVQGLQQSVITLTSQVLNLERRAPPSTFDSKPTSVPHVVSAPDNAPVFSLDTAFTAMSGNTREPVVSSPTPIRPPSAAAGSFEQLGLSYPGGTSHVRTAFGFSAESLPVVETVSPQARQQIIQGRDVNLSALLIPYFSGPFSDTLDPGKSHTTDARLNKILTIGEFIQAFGIYKNVMCSVYPQCRQELDLYERDIVDMATCYPGKGFYDYHRQFSATAAAQLRYNNVKVDWAVRNNSLFCNIFANAKATSCSHCASILHSTDFCPQSRAHFPPFGSNPGSQDHSRRRYISGAPRVDTYGRTRIFQGDQAICNNYNTKQCHRL